MTNEGNLERARTNLRNTEADIARQRSIIARLEKSGRPTLGARTMLGLLEQELGHCRETLKALEQQSHRSH